jgi:large subunit ribosomal protein L35
MLPDSGQSESAHWGLESAWAGFVVLKETSVPKQKTHKGAAKRFKVTGTGKVTRHQAMHSHFLTKKTTKRKRNLRKSTEVSTAFAGTIKHMLHD